MLMRSSFVWSVDTACAVICSLRDTLKGRILGEEAAALRHYSMSANTNATHTAYVAVRANTAHFVSLLGNREPSQLVL